MVELGKELISRPNKKIYVSKDGKSLIKVFSHSLVSKANVLAEALNQARVEETKAVVIPNMQEVFKHGEDWCIAYDFVKGVTLEEKMESDKANEKKYIEKMLDLQVATQKVTVDSLPSLTGKLQERISLSKEFLSATSRYELHVRLDSMPKHTKLCHCDFNPTNIILGEDGKEYITDWAHAAKGNASADVAYTYMWFMERGREDLAKYYLDLFCKKTDTAIQYVQRWMPIVAAAMAYKATAEERKFLLSQTEVVEYE